MEECFFEIADGEDLLRIDHFSRPYPNADNPWDKNALQVRVSVHAHPFSGSYEADMMTTDFEGFKTEFEKLYKDLSGVARFNDREGYLDIVTKGDGLGHFVAECVVQSDWVQAPRLTFKLSFDQTFIVELVDQLKTILSKYPTYRS